MSRACFVPGCGNTQRKNPNLNFFSVTNKRDLKEKWLEAIERGTGCLLDKNLLDSPVSVLGILTNCLFIFKYFKDTLICSSHFTFDEHNIQNGSQAVPSIFKPVSFYMDNETLAKCRICLKAQGLEELTLQDTLPKSRISIADAVKKSFMIDVSFHL